MFGNDNNNYNPSSAYMTYPVRHGAYMKYWVHVSQHFKRFRKKYYQHPRLVGGFSPNVSFPIAVT